MSSDIFSTRVIHNCRNPIPITHISPIAEVHGRRPRAAFAKVVPIPYLLLLILQPPTQEPVLSNLQLSQYCEAHDSSLKRMSILGRTCRPWKDCGVVPVGLRRSSKKNRGVVPTT
jgi:hypothetical protein